MPLLSRPPKRTRLPVPGSKSIEAARRAGGLTDGFAGFQLLPLRAQVSFRPVPPLSLPPKRIRLPEAGSKAIDASIRSEGLPELPSFSSVQVLPVRDQVSLTGEVPSPPPKRTMLPVAGS